ncbi:MAG: UDP-2,3-diacylglucosamine diphosphatase [Woeseia sp.]|nr:UDP-2,3-diacylglucosamine diphosphatase [Woeseia sp.]
MTTLFVSDLHIHESQPEIGEQFARFLKSEALAASALYILGDLFESWVGDDDPNPHYAETKKQLRTVSNAGVPVFFMHGNRDFMIGEQFAAQTGVCLLKDPVVLTIHGKQVLLSHGDAYCTDDHEYQAVRRMTRDPQWQAMMLQKSLEERLAFAAQARADSIAKTGKLNDDISDVNSDAIENVMREHAVSFMLHGHTHRPAVHRFEIENEPATRIVLGDWYDQGSAVRWGDDGFSLTEMPR